MLDETKELAVRSWLTERASDAGNVNFAISEPWFFTGKEDFAGQLGVTTEAQTDDENAAAIENLLCDFVMASFGRLDDTGRGAVHCPVMRVTYDFTIFQEFKPGRENDTNAHNRHVATVLQIWRKFLTGHKMPDDPGVRHFGMTQNGKTVLNQTLPNLPGVKGFYTFLQTIVEVA